MMSRTFSNSSAIAERVLVEACRNEQDEHKGKLEHLKIFNHIYITVVFTHSFSS